MTFCPTCGRPPAVDVVQRGPLRVEDQPPAAYWRGLRMRMTPVQIRVLRPLVRFGAVGHGVFEMLFIDAETASDRVKTHVHQLRRILAQHTDGQATISSERGWGYRLEVGAVSPG